MRLRPWLAAAVVLTLPPVPCAAQFAKGDGFIGPALSLSTSGTAPVIEGHFEKAMSRNLGVGVFAGYWSYGESFSGVSADYSYFAAGVAGAYHFEVKANPKWDPFVGGGVGYYFVNSDIGGIPGAYDADDSRPFVGVFGGTRYFVSPSIGLVGRLGIGATYLSLGVDFRL